MSHLSFDRRAGGVSKPHTQNAFVPQDQSRSTPTPFSFFQSSPAPNPQLKGHQHYEDMRDGVLLPSLPELSTGIGSNVNADFVHHDVLATLGDSHVIPASALAMALQRGRQHLQPPHIPNLLDMLPSPHDLN
eukprot:scpid108180/ scgid12228/ 